MLTLKETLDTLKLLGHEPNKKLGQNFLIDKNIVAKSVELADLKAGERVVEIGPGLGTLTGAIVSAGGNLTCIEQDTSLLPYLTEKFPSVHFINDDATQIDYKRFGDFKIIANLPYAVSSILLEKFLFGLPSQMVLMVQRELAERYCAREGKSFSALSIFLQSAYQLQIAHIVSRKCFLPRPKVESCLLVLKRIEKPIIFSAELQKIIRTLFINRRKQLRKAAEANPISKVWFNKLVEEEKIKETARAEEIYLELWQRLA
jgi:16S rRNA (adenine1518-N6/adenine1519-N6)-dimethyltransferase